MSHRSHRSHGFLRDCFGGLGEMLYLCPLDKIGCISEIKTKKPFFILYFARFALPLRLRLENTLVRENSKKFWFSTHLFVPLHTKRAKLLTQFAGRNVQTTTIMASVTSIPKPAQMIITLEDNALVADIKRALKMIRGVASVRVAKVDDDKTITPAMRQSIKKARREYAKGETITCRTPEEMQKYFDSL